MNRSVNTVTPRCRVILEKVITLWLVKKITAFSGFRKFINVFTKARHKTKSGGRAYTFLAYYLLAIRGY
jgi:hypothetical protein